ncbi:hypothetical protein PIB30_072346, partial [Stylosanthes scabra]|nr:hypothetical protein [Stylosanthes scabra]
QSNETNDLTEGISAKAWYSASVELRDAHPASYSSQEIRESPRLVRACPKSSPVCIGIR